MPADSPPTAPDRINALRLAPLPSFALLAGMQLDLFTPLGQGPLDAGALAGKLGVTRAKLEPLLYALVDAELLTVADGRFANTPEADQFLVRGKPTYMGAAHELFHEIWHAAFSVGESIRSGVPQARHDFAGMSLDELSGMLRGLQPGAVATGRVLAERLDLASSRHLIDIGGGTGGLSIGACERCPELTATVVELPVVAPIAEACIDEAGLSDRITVEVGDAASTIPSARGDVAVLRFVMQVQSPTTNAAILRNAAQAVEPGGSLHIVGQMVDDSRLTPVPAVRLNLAFLSFYDDGLAHSESEHRQWLEAAGLTVITRETLPDGASLMTGRKP